MKHNANAGPVVTARLTVRPIEAEDWQSVRDIWDDVRKTEYSVYDTPKDTGADAVRQRIARWAEATKSGTEHVFFAACLDGKVIGYASFNARPGGYETGYAFLSEYHGKGYAGEALTAAFGIMRSLGAEKIFAGTALKNTPSVRLLANLGFRMTGTESVSFYKDSDGKDVFFEGGVFEKDLLQKI